ncbi:MAG: DUF6485 family protein [Ignavibacteria bacterium]|nr:DUF6485 family protein [Ignavibacteria bacterium]
MECKIERNLNKCNCTYEPCSRKGLCCECLRYHLNNRELPACFFPKDAERTYNRSFEFFISLYNKGKI